MRRRVRALAVMTIVLAAASSAPPRARAQSTELALSVTPDARGCLTEPALRARVRRWLAADTQPSGLHVEVAAETPPVRVTLLRAGAVIAERRFELLPDACDDRLDAVALAIAIALEHAVHPERDTTVAGAGAGTTATARAGANANAAATPGAAAGANGRQQGNAPQAATQAAGADKPAAGSEKSAEPAAAAPPKPSTAPRAAGPAPEKTEPEPEAEPEDTATARPARVRVLAGAGLLLSATPQPTQALGLDAGAELLFGRRFALQLAALYATAKQQDLSEGRVKVQLFGGRALGCLGWPLWLLSLETCAGAVGGAVDAAGSGFGAGNNHRSVLAWVAGAARLSARVPADGLLGLRLALDGHASVLRPELVVSPATRGMQGYKRAAPPLGGAISLELVLALR